MKPLFYYVYNKVKYNIQVMINKFSYLIFIIDKFFNINQKRITNISCYIKFYILYLSSQNISAYIYNA